MDSSGKTSASQGELLNDPASTRLFGSNSSIHSKNFDISNASSSPNRYSSNNTSFKVQIFNLEMFLND
ncbi:unnamed protein product [Ambrosiozyma monospora]|uniref:Unnamed protein product n=1 Tax=Ambrosiozyma monospora TaxID=43982 RepID=A0ACB5TUM4_AMBMO|nr:unnamed protein product [Ambrosiozyma monospora]